MEQNNMHIHSFEDIVVPSTCKENGYTLHRCACGYEHKDNFKPLGKHQYRFTDQTLPTCTEAGVQNFSCTVCGEFVSNTVAPLGHEWGPWSTQTFATCTEDGAQVHVCSRCQQAEQQIIPAKGHKLVNPKKSETEEGMMEYFCENCGQTVLQPIPVKKPGFFKRYKKAMIISLVVLLIVGLAAAVPLHIIPACHYMNAKNLLHNGDYINAYYELKEARGFNDAEVLLRDFAIRYEEINSVIYDKDGNQISFTGYKYDEQGRCISALSYDNDGALLSGEETTYDSNGNITVEISYRNGVIEYRKEYTYNENGNIICEAVFEYLDGVLQNKTVTTYDDYGNKLTIIEYDGNGVILNQSEWEYIITYENGNIVFSDPDTSGWHSVYIYRKDGKILEHTFFAGNGDIEYQDKYEYDDQGNLTRKVDIYKKGKYNGDTVYEYDEYGTLISEIERDADDNVESKIEYNSDGHIIYLKNNWEKFEYEYDEHGNMICQSGYYDWGEEREEYEITIEYEYVKHGIINSSKTYDQDGNLICKNTCYNPTILYQPRNNK